MLEHFGVDFFENDAGTTSFNTTLKSGGNGKIYLKAYAPSEASANMPMFLFFRQGSTYEATVLGASYVGAVGVAETRIASGCVGWIQIRGHASNVQFGTADASGSQGNAVFWGAGALGASSSAAGLGLTHQVGVVIGTELNGSTTGDIFLWGRMDRTPQA